MSAQNRHLFKQCPWSQDLISKSFCTTVLRLFCHEFGKLGNSWVGRRWQHISLVWCMYAVWSWICLRLFLTLYHGKSPLDHHLGKYVFAFSKHFKQIQVFKRYSHTLIYLAYDLAYYSNDFPSMRTCFTPYFRLVVECHPSLEDSEDEEMVKAAGLVATLESSAKQFVSTILGITMPYQSISYIALLKMIFLLPRYDMLPSRAYPVKTCLTHIAHHRPTSMQTLLEEVWCWHSCLYDSRWVSTQGLGGVDPPKMIWNVWQR